MPLLQEISEFVAEMQLLVFYKQNSLYLREGKCKGGTIMYLCFRKHKQQKGYPELPSAPVGLSAVSKPLKEK